ncbi:MAG: hypothetical protein ACYDAO_09050 [Thermoplasmataceae archaeon]
MSKVKSDRKIFAILIVIGFILVGAASIMGTGHQGNGINGPSNSTFLSKTNNPQSSLGQSVSQRTKDTSVNINHVVPSIIKSQKDAAIKGNYTLTLVEKGLPSGSLWNATTSYYNYSLSFTLFNKTNSSATTKIGFSLANGSYDFKVKSNGYGGNASFYSITINGKSTTFNVSFSKAYDVKFVEKGLPSGSLWNAYNTSNSYVRTGINSSNGNELNASLTNGTYSDFIISSKGFDAYMGNYTQSSIYSGIEYNYATFTVNGNGFTINVTFKRLYEVNFNESGLPSVNSWTVYIYYNGSGAGIGTCTVNSTVNSNLLINGTYPYSPGVSHSLSSMNGYAAPSGTIKVAGKNLTVNITFSKSSTSNYYTVTFIESGLLNNTTWSMTLNGTDKSSSTSTITFSLPNGTYNYNVNSIAGYQLTSQSGKVMIDGNNISQGITFTVIKTNTPRPSWAFNGFYENYTVNYAVQGTSYSMYINDSLINVNTYSGIVEIMTKGWIFYNGAYISPPASFTNVSWNDIIFALNSTMINELNQGKNPFNSSTLSNLSISSPTISTGITVNTKLGGILTDSLSFTNASSSTNFSFYFSESPGIAVKFYFQNATTKGSYIITSTNVPLSTANSRYNVLFNVTNYIKGTTWYLNITGQSSSGPITANTYTVNNLRAGAYSYTIQNTNKTYSAINGSFSTTQTNTVVQITFIKSTYAVKFTESGLPTGVTWYVNITGQTASGPINAGSSFSISLTNGTYTYKIATTDKNYSASGNSFTVNGKSSTQSISFTKASTSPLPSFNDGTYILIGAVVAVVGIGAAAALIFKRKR